MTAETNISARTSRRIAVVAITAVVLLAAVATVVLLWRPWEPAADADHDHEPGTIYTCPMHPQIREPEPGICPICFMDLVPVSEGPGDDTLGADGIQISPRGRVVADVQTVEVGSHRFRSSLVSPATVDYNEASRTAVTSRYGGRIENLYVDKTGQFVRRGDRLMKIYSPDLLTAQQELLVALESKPIPLPGIGGFDNGESAEPDDRSLERWRRLVASSRKKLELYGMSAAQINQLEKRREVTYETTVFAPAGGYVTELAVSEGAYVKEGTLLMELVNLSSVWVMIDVNENRLWRIRPGMDVSLSGPALGGEVAYGRVDYVYPEVDPTTRTARVRAVFPNPGLQLKPGMYLTATILIPQGESLAVPASSVIRTGRRNLVYVEVDENTFEARDVKLGEKHDGYYEVLSGELALGDVVVEHGGYLLDSERQLR